MRLLCCLAALVVLALQHQCHGLLLPLTNTMLSSLRGANGTATPVHHLLRASSLRSAARHGRHRARRSPPSPPSPGRHRQLSLPLSPGSDYTLSLSVGPASAAAPLSGRFSYCLVSHSFRADRLIRPSPLILGRSPDDDADAAAAETDGFVYTPLLHNPKHPYFYSVALEAVSVGAARIQARPELARVDRAGNGGMVVDSGTTFTMLPNEMYARVAEAFARAMAAAGFARAERAEEQTGLTPCYRYAASDRGVPPLALHFRGNATVALPRRNYFMGFKSEEAGAGTRKDDVGCLMLMNGGDASGEEGDGPAGTLGNFQQQGFEVVYDVDAGRVGFARRRCTDLWDSLSRR
ncbi:putative aspartyl protease [Zea mays]|uniref:Putative aspartyl protease n=1 Tax=Zea mays TaxID=4577 RepID=A0A3L6FUT3_MAIZE|nr:putative aspartyl protease [Zea mays]